MTEPGIRREALDRLGSGAPVVRVTGPGESGECRVRIGPGARGSVEIRADLEAAATILVQAG